MSWNLSDHLNSSSLTVDDTGTIIQSLDYFPFGSERINTGSYQADKTYTNHYSDSETGLLYAGARYHSSRMRRWVSIDPFHMAIGTAGAEGISGMKMNGYLANPQVLNAYTYALNNPMVYIDPTGAFFSVGFIRNHPGAQSLAMQMDNTSLGKFALDNPEIAGAGVGVAVGLTAYGLVQGATYLSVQYLGGAGTSCMVFCSKAGEVAQRAPQTIQAIDYTARYGSDLGGRMNQVSQNLQGGGHNFSHHAIQRITQRIGVGNEQAVLNTLNTKPIQYVHNGAQKLGYYDQVSRIFVGKAADSGRITTVITNVSEKYVSNLVK